MSAAVPSHARVVIIGGGVMGVSALYHLTRLGWSEVVLFEKSELTAGSTWHAAGLCTHFAHSPTIMEMRAHSVRLYRGQLAEETGVEVGFHPSGALRITRSPDRLDEFAHVQGLGRFTGCEFHIIGPDEVRELHPLARVNGLAGAIFEPHDGHVDPSQATQAMAAGARRGGATIRRHCAIELIERVGGDAGWRVTTAKGSVLAEHVVNAAGTWCREVGAMMGVDLPVVPMLHQYIVTSRIGAVAALEHELPIIRDPEESWYVRQERDGLIVGPYEKDAKAWSVDGVPAGFGMELLEPDLVRIEPIVECAMRRVPALAEGGVRSVVNGPITFTPDANPLIGPAFGLPNSWLLTGSSMGVMEGGGAGRFLAEWIVAGEPPMDAQVVDPRRFGSWADRDYRVAKATECFARQFAIHYPVEERPAGRPVRISPLYRPLLEAGAVMGSVNGWERPNYFARNESEREPELSFRRCNWFGAVAEECRRVSDSVGVAELTALAKFEVSGPDAIQWLSSLGANRAPETEGHLGLMHVLTPSGGMAAEFTVTRLDGGRFYLTGSAVAVRHDLDLLRSRSDGLEVLVEDVTAERGVLAVMGPAAPTLLGRLTCTNLDAGSFPWLTARQMEVAGVMVHALRVSYAGEPGFELHVPMPRMGELYAAVVEEGTCHDLVHFGAFALNAMRLEKGYRAFGLDLGTERTPIEAGLGHLVKTSGRTFVGRDRMLERESGRPWRMALLELEDHGVDAFGLHTVLHREEAVGLVTSGAFGHRVRTSLALAWFREGAPDPADELRVGLPGHEVRAQVLRNAPYDAANARLRGMVT